MSKDYRKILSYGQFNNLNNYLYEPGAFALPVATCDCDEDPVVVVRAHAPYATRNVTFDAQKDGTPPVVPAPADSGCFAFLGGCVQTMPTLNQTGSGFNWTTQGILTFVQTVRSDPVKDGLVLSNFPFPLEIQQQNKVQYGQLVPNGGPVGASCEDVQVGYAQAQAVSFSDPSYEYDTPTYLPGIFFDPNLISGGHS